MNNIFNSQEVRRIKRTRKRDYFNPKIVFNKAFTRMRAYNKFKDQVEMDDKRNNQIPTVTKFDGKFIYV